MSFLKTQGLGRDPQYHGKFGIPDYIVNTPQKPAQWWAVAAFVLLLALPFGVLDLLDGAGTAPAAGYGVLFAVALMNAWLLRNDINETVPFLAFAMAGGVALLLGGGFTALRSFQDSHVLAGLLTLGAAVIGLHNTYRAWQGLLVIGIFTEQKVPPDSPYYKA